MHTTQENVGACQTFQQCQEAPSFYQYAGSSSSNMVSPYPSNTHHQGNQGYLPLPATVKYELPSNSTISGISKVKEASKHSKTPNNTTVDNAFSNVVYKQWKSKYATKDSNGFHCLVCQNKNFTADSSLRRHYKQTHEQICNVCKMEFPEEHLLIQHIREKHEYRCTLCDKVFTANSSLKRHYERQHGGASTTSLQSAESSASPGIISNTDVKIDVRCLSL